MDELEAIEKPSVLAAHPRCLRVGLEIGASCDFRLAAEGASFALPELPSLGVIPGSGGISRVTRLVGPHWGSGWRSARRSRPIWRSPWGWCVPCTRPNRSAIG